jgi:hypothetical protein
MLARRNAASSKRARFFEGRHPPRSNGLPSKWWLSERFGKIPERALDRFLAHCALAELA